MYRIKLFYPVLFLLSWMAAPVVAQTDSIRVADSLHQELKEQVWDPMIASLHMDFCCDCMCHSNQLWITFHVDAKGAVAYFQIASGIDCIAAPRIKHKARKAFRQYYRNHRMPALYNNRPVEMNFGLHWKC